MVGACRDEVEIADAVSTETIDGVCRIRPKWCVGSCGVDK
jgi:hypothetical protein